MLIICGLVFLSSCTDDSQRPQDREAGTISALVIDKTLDQPVADVTVTLTPGNVVMETDSSGEAVFRVSPGNYFVDANVCCAGPGGIDYHIPVTVREGKTTTVEMPACLLCLSPASGLTLDVEVEPPMLRRGETVRIGLRVKNQSDAPVVRHFASGCIYGFSLWNDEGERVAPPPRVCTMNAPVVRYAPGEVVDCEFEWAWDDPDIPRGTYSLVVGLGRRGEIESAPPIKIQLQ